VACLCTLCDHLEGVHLPALEKVWNNVRLRLRVCAVGCGFSIGTLTALKRSSHGEQ